MELYTLNRMRKEERVQKWMLIISVCSAALVMLVLYLSSIPGESPARSAGPAAATDQQPVESGLEPLSSPTEEETVTTEAVAETEAVETLATSAAVGEDEAPEAETLTGSTVPEAGTVSGIVLRKGHDTPVRRLRLQLVDAQGEEVAACRSATDGTFLFKDIAPGKYYLKTISENFNYRRRPLVVGEEPVSGVRFQVLPNPPVVKIPRYSRFNPASELPSVGVNVFRFGKVAYRIYKLELAESFLNVISLDDLLNSDVSKLVPLETFDREYSYSVSFSERSDSIDLDVSKEGLYLVEAEAGGDSFRGLVSLGSLDLVTTQSGSTLQVMVLGLGSGGPTAMVKVAGEGLLCGEGSTDASGMFMVNLERRGVYEVLVSDGTSFAWALAEHKPTSLALR